MKKLNYVIALSFLVISVNAMEQEAKGNKTLNQLSKELSRLGILINLDATSEKDIFSFTDKLIKKGPESARVVRKMIQEYARNTNKSNWKNYTYRQFKLDIMDMIIKDKVKKYKNIHPEEDIEQIKVKISKELDAELWINNEVESNIDFGIKYMNLSNDQESWIERSEKLQLQAKQFEKRPTITSNSSIPSNASKGWLSKLSDWWHGSNKEEKK